MIKRLIALISSAALLLCLAACGNSLGSSVWKQSRASEEIEPYGLRALEIIDGYLSFKMTSSEATEAFDELDRRIESLGVRGSESEYPQPDRTIAHCITILSIGEFDRWSDLELREYRDLIAYQLCETVSGKSYAPDQVLLTDEDITGKYIDIASTPFMSSNYNMYDETLLGTMSFDQISGVTPYDLEQYIRAAYGGLSSQKTAFASLHFYYSRYEQSVFTISIYLNDGEFYGYVYRSDNETSAALAKLIEESENNGRSHEEIQTEYDAIALLYAFESIDALSSAIQAACDFAG